jgi:YaiO family outer membrane protein
MLLLSIIHRKTFICLFSVFLLAGKITAQDTMSSDDLFAMARKAAFDEKDRTSALELSRKALEISPGYTDILIFVARIYSWEKKLDSSRHYFQRALQQKPSSEDAHVGYADMEYWNDNNEKALEIVNMGLSYQPGSTLLLLRKAKMLNALKYYRAAMLIADTLLKIDKTNTEVRALADRIKDNVSVNKIGISYDFLYFDKQFDDPWHLTSLQYSRQTFLGSIIARVNHANRFKENGLQYEIDAYPRISKTFYAYLNGGYSDNTTVFSKWRAGASLYANLPASFEAELGIRYLYFTSGSLMYTAYAGKYYRNYLFGARTYIVPSNNTRKISHSYSAMARYYYGGADDFFAVNIGYGISPDDRPLSYQLIGDQLTSYRVGLEYRHAFKTFNIIGLSASVLNQEYLPKTKGNQIQAGVVYQRRF